MASHFREKLVTHLVVHCWLPSLRGGEVISHGDRKTMTLSKLAQGGPSVSLCLTDGLNDVTRVHLLFRVRVSVFLFVF